LPEVPGCGFASFATAIGPPTKPIAEGLTLRTERFELTVSKKTGGIQSLRTLRDRNTRVSQRLVFHHQTGEEPAQTQMIADRVGISRNDSVVGEITSQGRVLGAAADVLANFTQRVRAVRGLPVMIVDVELDPQHLPAGDIWKSYFASRLAWSVESLSIRRGKNWSGLETTRECIDSSEWVEIDDGLGHVTCFPLGLPFHRVAGPQWLDTLLLVAGEERRRFQFAIGIDGSYPTHAALALLSACDPYVCASPSALSSPRGWFVHVGAKNVLSTHIEPLTEQASGIRVRLLEIEGRDTQTTLAAFRPFTAAWLSDFRGNRADVLSLADGRAQIDIGPHGWVQIEAEW
jgi:alpha-mannosidase